MADHDIQKSKQLLKRLEEEMDFVRSLTSQIANLSSQAFTLSSTIKELGIILTKSIKAGS